MNVRNTGIAIEDLESGETVYASQLLGGIRVEQSAMGITFTKDEACRYAHEILKLAGAREITFIYPTKQETK